MNCAPPSIPADEPWPDALSYWRTLPAEAFRPGRRHEVVACVHQVGSTMAEWRAAIEGDAAAACGIALRMQFSSRIGLRTDMAMTILLRCAFYDRGAAVVLASRLLRAPIDPVFRTALARSWMLHKPLVGQGRRWGRLLRTPRFGWRGGR